MPDRRRTAARSGAADRLDEVRIKNGCVRAAVGDSRRLGRRTGACRGDHHRPLAAEIDTMSEIGETRRRGDDLRHYRRGMFLLPSIFTVANLFCGYACIIYSMRGELVMAALF